MPSGSAERIISSQAGGYGVGTEGNVGNEANVGNGVTEGNVGNGANVGNEANEGNENIQPLQVNKSNPTAQLNDVKFTLTGSYYGIVDFLYDIQDDPEINFKIEDFNLIPAGATNVLQATFVVKNIKIVK